MAYDDSLSRILGILSLIKEDSVMLSKVCAFLEAEIVPELEKEDTIVIPEKYEALVNGIAQSLQIGFICYLNMDSLEVEEIHQDSLDAYRGGMDEEEVSYKHLTWENKLEFEPLHSSEAFRIMEDFASQLDNLKVREILLDILDRKKPFAHFNNFIHHSNYREDWFAFKTSAYEQHVRNQIYLELDQE